MSPFLGPLDIHARRIDNYGDAGWSWRLAREFAYRKTATTVRFFFDDLELLSRMEPSLSPELTHQRVEGVEVYDINRLTAEEAASIQHPDLLLEIFGTTPPERLYPSLLLPAKLRIQMEYLSAESWTVESHLLPSPLGWGPPRHFYFSGFSPESGGILLDSRFDKDAREVKADSEGTLTRFLQPFGLASPPGGDPLKVFFFPIKVLHRPDRGLQEVQTAGPSLPLGRNLCSLGGSSAPSPPRTESTARLPHPPPLPFSSPERV